MAGYNKWKKQFERHVKRGEHGITIIAPTPYKKKIEEQKLDPDTKAPMLDKMARSSWRKRNRDPAVPPGEGVRHQPDGRQAPAGTGGLSFGNVPNYEVFMEALRRSAPVPIEV